jgi:pyruvate-ferredoxin/flavodoxin oxidoreductase
MPEFVYNPRKGETIQEAFDLKGNPSMERDWWQVKDKATNEDFSFTVAHWAITEGRFRKHIKTIKEEEVLKLPRLEDFLYLITQDDVVYRRVFDAHHRSHVPNFGVYIKAEFEGKVRYFAVSRQMVLFAVERRKAWRMLQSRAGVVNKDYLAQKALLKRADAGEIPVADLRANIRTLIQSAATPAPAAAPVTA